MLAYNRESLRLINSFQRQQFSVDELEELAKDARLIKKFKAGKVFGDTLIVHVLIMVINFCR